MPRIRMTQRRTLKWKARDKAIAHVTAAIAPVLAKQYRVLKRELRRGNLRKTLRKVSVPSSLTTEADAAFYRAGVLLGKQGQDPTQQQKDRDTWEKWIALLALLLGDNLVWSADVLAQTENDVWTSRGLMPVPFNPQDLVQSYQQRIGTNIDNIGPDTLSSVQSDIAAWYTSDASFQDLVAQLGQYFDERRAQLIARTEVGNLDSQVSLEAMRAYGVLRWRWDALGPNPCDYCLPLNGTWHDISEGMPPDAAHPGCYCLPYFNPEDGAFM